jgi:23S rRNA (uracil1939-C5)-methyltransferase
LRLNGMAEIRQLAVTRLGAQGDGVAETASGPVFVPFALPGETVRAAVDGERGTLLDVISPSPDRVTAVCRHFGMCGGCTLQHLAAAPYADWKRQLVLNAFEARGIACHVEPVHVADGYRRRAVFTAVRSGADVHLGFNRAASHDLIDIAECPVLDKRIVAARDSLKGLLEPLLPRRETVRLTVLATMAGLDVNIEGIAKALTPELRSHVADTAHALRLARVSINGEPVYVAAAPTLDFSGAPVIIPPAGFVQAMADGERIMVEEIMAAIGKVKTVADLFCGAGAFTFPLARRAKVTAFDSGAASIAAIVEAARMSPGFKPITARVRDLFREPLSALELKPFDAVVFDPPRAGSEGQARMLARSVVKTVIAVSCNPATLARDVRLLIDGGYRLERVKPVDQFRYTPHVEVVAVLRR